MNTFSSDPLRALFDAALERAPAERTAYLEAHCPDPALRARVLALLEADARTSDSLRHDWAGRIAEGLGEDDAPAPHDAPLLPPDGRIGPFRIVRVIGEGGFSTVFEAERSIEGVTQRVALKLLHCGLHTADARRRFEHERRALLQLRHPNITRMIDAGVTDTGQPYIALELIDGIPITDYARQHRLDLPARLALFTEVCRAVEAAHRALIVHRDIKPSNVLVSADGAVSLLDFGIAKLLDAPDESRTVAPAFTPAYAAPEQRAAGPITTAIDVYALGILLDELITGERRAPGETRTPSSRVAHTARNDALPAPPAAMRKLLRGDLDNIVLKAIAEEPERRYASASALAEDIERHLARRPVLAHPPSNWYRARKFVARHRGGVATTVAFLLALLTALGMVLWQGHLAQREALRANAMRDFMFDAFSEATPSVPRDGPPNIADVVEQAIDRARTDKTLHPGVRSELVSELGAVLLAQGSTERAYEVLQWNHAHSMQELGESAHETLIASLQLGRLLTINGDLPGGRALLDGASQSTREPRLRAALLFSSARAAAWEHELGVGLAKVEEALRITRSLGDANALERALKDYGNVQFAAGHVEAAIVAGEEVLRLREQRYGSHHVQVSVAHADLSRAYNRAGRHAEAERAIRTALAIDDATLPPDHWSRALHLNALTMIQYQQRDFHGALASARQSYRINRLAFGPDHPDLISDLNSISMLHLALEDFATAKESLHEALERATTTLSAEHYYTAILHANYGLALAADGEIAAGEAEIQHAVALLEAAQEPDIDDIARSWEKLARVRLDRDDAVAALEAIDCIDALPATGTYWDGRVATLRASALLQLGRAAEARPLLDTAIAALAASKNPDPVLRAEAPLLDANARLALGQHDEAGMRAARDALAGLRNPPRRLIALAERLGEAPR